MQLEGKNPILKMDIEGGEYWAILPSAAKVLRSFDTIIMEYHHGYKNLCRKLTYSGFKIEYLGPPSYSFSPHGNPAP